MRSPITCLVVLSLVVVSGMSWAGPGKPDRFQPDSLDQQLTQTINPVDGRVWSAWSYRNGAEYDIAVTVSGADAWAEPVFFGLDDGIDQSAPSLASDASGNVYLAFTQGSPGRVLLTVLGAGARTWAMPVVLTPPAVDARSPAVRVIGGRLALAFAQGSERLTILDLPLYSPGFLGGNGFTDGPDPVGSSRPETGDDDDDGGTTNDGTDDPIVPMSPNGAKG